jgi:hypothetical protein
MEMQHNPADTRSGLSGAEFYDALIHRKSMGFTEIAPPEQNGDIWDNHGNFAPRQKQFTPANPQYVPDSFRFNPFRVNIDARWREIWLIPGYESRKLIRK